MASAIDATKPADDIEASKAELRANLATAKSEISALQVQVGTISPYIFGGMRNRIINGKMILDTRNLGVGKSITPATYAFIADRWFASSGIGGGTFLAITTTTGGPTGFPNYTRIITTTPKTLVAADAHAFVQAIEGYHWADMLYGSADAVTATLSFWVRASIAGNYAVALTNTGGANTYVAQYTISVANTWEYKSITIPGPTSGTFPTTSAGAIAVRFDIGTGSTYQGATAVWTATNKVSYIGSTNVISTNGATWDVTGVQLEPGSVATPWDNRLLSTEYALSSRYIQAGANNRWDGYTINTVGYSTPISFSPIMRTTPTISISIVSATSFPLTAPIVVNPNPAGFYALLAANATGGAAFVFNWSADAELII